MAQVQTRPRRLTQPERSAVTQQALLDSTIACLSELGYDRATIAEITERAGVSHGAHLHHYGTRQALLAAAAGELAKRACLELEAAVDRLPNGARRQRAALDMLWGLFTGPLYQAMLELAVHARTDPELRVHLETIEAGIGQVSRPLLRQAFGRDAEDGSFDDLISMAMATTRGVATLPLLEPNRDPERIWSRCRGKLLALMDQAD